MTTHIRATSHSANVLATGFSFLVTVVLQVVSVPLLLHRLGATDFAVFQVIISLLTWSALAPLGTDRALKNALSTSRVQKSADDTLLRDARGLLLCIFVSAGLVIVTVGGLFSYILVSPLAGRPLELLFVASCLAMLVYGLGNFGREALLSEHRGRTVAWLQIANVTGIFVALLLFSMASVGTPDALLTLALAAWLVPHALASVAALWLARLLPIHLKIEWRQARGLLAPGLRFLLFSLATTGLYGTDYFILARLGDPSSVVLYSVCSRVTGAFVLLTVGVLALYWPRWTESLARGELAIVRRSVLEQAAFWAITSLVLTLLFLAIFEPLCRIWLDDPGFVVPHSTIIWMGISLTLRTWCECFMTALLAASYAGRLTMVVGVQAIVTVGLQFSLYPLLGVDALFAGFALGALATAAWILPVALLRVTEPNGAWTRRAA
jgi:O-antigen/teichoic acid export membrane protein